ncbi:MAG: TonB-dependent receptor, partial [Ignavibacteriae bacterium]|nr:TonB-dependent receptor [Ignavibacteriota bacterium]
MSKLPFKGEKSMLRYGSLKNLVALFVLMLSFLNFTFAGTTGSLKGKVTDVSNGDALPGVNILLVGSGRGATTNSNGEFLVTGIAPGKYTLRISSIGYKTLESKNILIEVDETTVYNVKLASEDIELEGVTVEGKRPLIDVKKTASDQTFNRDKLEQLPNLKGVNDVLTLQAGVVRFGNQIFLRGGRANETQIMIDGVVVNDASGGGVSADNANQLLQQLYSGSATTGAGLPAEAIQSVSTSSSGLDAEFGNAQSGVVSITTKTGAEKFSGSGQYRTDGLTNSSFGERYYSGSISGPEPISTYLLPSLGVEIPGKFSFYTSGSFNQSDGPFSFTKSTFYNPVKRKIQLTGFFGSLLNNLGFNYSDRQNNEFAFNFKVTYNSGANDQVFYSYRANATSGQGIFGSYQWRDRYDSSTSTVSLQTQDVVQYKHFFSTNTELRAYISRLQTQRTSTIGNLTPDRYSSVTNFSNSYYRDPNNDGFFDVGSAQSWFKGRTEVWSSKVAFESQVHPLHFLKTGIEYYYQEFKQTQISYPLSPARQVDPNPRGEFYGYGLGRWVNYSTPSRGGFWLQDNIDFPGINIKLGIRYDFFYLGKQAFAQEFVNRYEAVVGAKADWLKNNSFGKALTSGNFSPRLAISYPISERASFYFNYGHQLQFPDLDQYFHDALFDSANNVPNNYVGNPAMKPQRTVQYEAGFKQLLFEDLSLQITGFYKDVFDLASQQPLLVNGRSLSRYINLDYASTRGFEIILEKGLSDHYSGSVNYTFQLAKGRAADPFVVQVTPQLTGLPRETRLDIDQQHSVNLFLGYRVRPNEDYELFGLPINNFAASVTWRFGSGFPYTPYNLGKTLSDLYLKNTGDGPYTSEINISLEKGFEFFQSLNLLLKMDVTNLLNRRNVNLSAGGFNSLTGAPYVYGDYNPSGSQYIYPWSGYSGGTSFGALVPP